MNSKITPDSPIHLITRCSSVSLLKRSLVSASIALAGLTLWSTAGSAATLFSDDFTGLTASTLNSDGWYFYGVSGGSAWGTGSDSTAPLSGTVLQNQKGAQTWQFGMKQFTSTTLTNLGDSLTLTLDYHVAADASGGQLWLKILNTANTVTSNDFTGVNPIADADGYAVVQKVEVTQTTADLKETLDDAYMGGTTIATTASSATLGATSASHTMVFSLTKVAAGTELSWTVDGNQLGSTIDSSGTIYNTFNSVSLMVGTGTLVNLDNISVVSVPEPQTWAMMVAGLGVLFGAQKLRRHQVGI